MPYDKTTGIITKPLNTRDIGLAVKSSSNNVDTLCEAPGINKWAKFKPIRYPKYGELTMAERQSKNFGLEYVPYYTSMKRLVLDLLEGKWDGADNYQPGMTPWDYAEPRGAEYNEPHRMLDFEGYTTDTEQIATRPAPAKKIYPGIAFSASTTLGKKDDYRMGVQDIKAVNGNQFVDMAYVGIGYIMGSHCTIKANQRLRDIYSHQNVPIISSNFPMVEETMREEVRLFVVLADRELDYECEDVTAQTMPEFAGTFIPVVPTINDTWVEIVAILVNLYAQSGWNFIFVPDSTGRDRIVGFDMAYFSAVFNGTYEHNFTVRATKDDGTVWAEAVYAPIVLNIQGEISDCPFELLYRSRDDGYFAVPQALLLGNDNTYNPISLTGTINNGDFWATIGREQIIITDRYRVPGSTSFGEITTAILP